MDPECGKSSKEGARGGASVVEHRLEDGGDMADMLGAFCFGDDSVHTRKEEGNVGELPQLRKDSGDLFDVRENLYEGVGHAAKEVDYAGDMFASKGLYVHKLAEQ